MPICASLLLFSSWLETCSLPCWKKPQLLTLNFLKVLPTGDVWSMLDSLVRIYKPDGTWYKTADGSPVDMPGFPTTISTQYLRSGASSMLGLTPDAADGRYKYVRTVLGITQ
jgi:hypothetical protein